MIMVVSVLITIVIAVEVVIIIPAFRRFRRLTPGHITSRQNHTNLLNRRNAGIVTTSRHAAGKKPPEHDTHVLQGLKVLAGAVNLSGGEILYCPVFESKFGSNNEGMQDFVASFLFSSSATAEVLHVQLATPIVKCEPAWKLRKINMALMFNHMRSHPRTLAACGIMSIMMFFMLLILSVSLRHDAQLREAANLLLDADAADLRSDAADAPVNDGRRPRDPVRSVASPAEEVRSLIVLSDGNVPGADYKPTAEDLIAGTFCGHCAAGPWHAYKSFSQHVLRQHSIRHELQNMTCPLCSREFTTLFACRRHVRQGSCGTYVCNHGRAGAVEGQRVKAARAKARQDHASQPAAQTPAPGASSGLRDARSFFHGRAAGSAASGNGDQAPAQGNTSHSEWQRSGEASGEARGSTHNRDETGRTARSGAARASSLEHSRIPLAEGE